jgi:hypothetical protein
LFLCCESAAGARICGGGAILAGGGSNIPSVKYPAMDEVPPLGPPGNLAIDPQLSLGLDYQ